MEPLVLILPGEPEPPSKWEVLGLFLVSVAVGMLAHWCFR